MLSISWEVLSDVLTEKAPKSSSRDGAGNSSVLRGLLKDYSVVIGKKLRGPLVSGCLRLGMWVSVLKTWYFLSTVYALFTLNVHVYYFYLTNYFTSLQSCTKQSSDSFQQNPPALFTASQTRAKYINYIFHDCRKMHNMFFKKIKIIWTMECCCFMICERGCTQLWKLFDSYAQLCLLFVLSVGFVEERMTLQTCNNSTVCYSENELRSGTRYFIKTCKWKVLPQVLKHYL